MLHAILVLGYLVPGDTHCYWMILLTTGAVSRWRRRSLQHAALSPSTLLCTVAPSHINAQIDNKQWAPVCQSLPTHHHPIPDHSRAVSAVLWMQLLGASYRTCNNFLSLSSWSVCLTAVTFHLCEWCADRSFDVCTSKDRSAHHSHITQFGSFDRPKWLRTELDVIRHYDGQLVTNLQSTCHISLCSHGQLVTVWPAGRLTSWLLEFSMK